MSANIHNIMSLLFAFKVNLTILSSAKVCVRLPTQHEMHLCLYYGNDLLVLDAQSPLKRRKGQNKHPSMRCTLLIEIYANYGVSNKIQISKFQPSKSWKSMKKLLTIPK